MEKPTSIEESEESIDEKYRRLLEENEKLKAELREKKTIINRAKDITPVVRPRTNRVFKVLWDIGMGLSRVADGWILESGNHVRKFKRLSTVWELLTTEGLGIKDIFMGPPVEKRAVISVPKPLALPPLLMRICPTPRKSNLLKKARVLFLHQWRLFSRTLA